MKIGTRSKRRVRDILFPMGITYALGALLFWAIGDFFIQKTSRKIGVVESLFFIGITGSVAFFPFVKNDLMAIFSDGSMLAIVCLAGIVMFFAALFNFEGLKDGKIAIVEPISSLEMPLTVLLSIVIIFERPTLTQLLLIAVIFIGVLLTITQHHTHLHFHKRIFEKGVAFAGIGAVGMALTDFIFGLSSRDVSSVVTIWFVHTIIATLCLVYILVKLDIKDLGRRFIKYPVIIITQSIADNLAWLFYGLAVITLPISIAITVSECYVVLAAMFGVFLNKEKLKKHQYAGVGIVFVGVIILSLIS